MEQSSSGAHGEVGAFRFQELFGEAPFRPRNQAQGTAR